jgi:anthranilate synthase component II
MKKVAVIDNYDSFTYNLVHYLEDLNAEVTVFRNDEIVWNKLDTFNKILLSPGPGIPDEAGDLKEVISKYATSKSILGICLGQQAMGEVFGGKIKNLDKVFHGIATPVRIVNEDTLFKELPNEFVVGRYHSWVIDTVNFPECLVVTTLDENQNIMSIRHKEYDLCGVQFHPESVLTPFGKKILENWLNH